MGIINKAKTSSKIQYSSENKIDEDVTLVNLKKTCNLINHTPRNRLLKFPCFPALPTFRSSKELNKNPQEFYFSCEFYF